MITGKPVPRRIVKTRAFDLSNQALTTYICKPQIVKYKQVSKLEPKLCKLVYIQCDINELCKISEIEMNKILNKNVE